MKRGRGQSSVEHLVLLVVIIGAFLVGGIYLKRGIQGRWKEAVDGMGDQYDPRVTNTDILHTVSGNSEMRLTTIPVNGGVWTLRDDESNMVDRTSGSTRVGAF